ncbi:MAG: hypothetical protein M1837_005107 [Sclerophora amabilis]|nr:MAG: hypothetical protein M1837_005107 [Sclerophora amabilis]
MGCCGRREKVADPKDDQKWDYINLSDFRSTSCISPLSYGILYISLFVSVSIYAVDTFTAINLLVLDQWPRQIKPTIPFDISKWIFAACIILSFINLGFEWVRATRVMRGGGIADSYLDPLAVRVQSVRFGQHGRGWRRFLVFAALTKGKKGVEYIALFTYFSFQAWFRVIVCAGPRQVINALTLFSVLQAELIPQGDHAPTNGETSFTQFWINLGILGQTSNIQVAILSGMFFSLVVWVVSALNLLFSFILYIVFLWHYIPVADGSLARFCKRKIDSSLHKIVSKTVRKAMEKEEAKRQKVEAKAIKAGEKPRPFKREPTVPILTGSQDDKFGMPSLTRSATDITLPPYSSRPSTSGDGSAGSEQQPTVPDISAAILNRERSNTPTRSGTQASSASNSSYGSNVPLTSAASGMGYSASSRKPTQGLSQPDRGLSNASDGSRTQMNRSAGPNGPARPPTRAGTAQSQRNVGYGPPSRAGTAQSQRNFGYGPPTRPGTAQSQRTFGYGPPNRPGTAQSQKNFGYGPSTRPGTAQSQNTVGYGPPTRPGTAQSQGVVGYGPSGPSYPPNSYDLAARGTPAPSSRSPDNVGRRTPAQQYGLSDRSGRSTPGFTPVIPGQAAGEVPRSLPNRVQTPQGNVGNHSASGNGDQPQYVAFNPHFHTPTDMSPRTSTSLTPRPLFQPHRNVTDPSRTQTPVTSGPPPILRSGTAPPQQDRSGYSDSIYDAYGAGDVNDAQRQSKAWPPPRAATTQPSSRGLNAQGRPPPPAENFSNGFGASF